MRLLQEKRSDAITGISKELKSAKLVHQLLQDNLDAWRNKARSEFAAILGFPGWRSPSKKKVHPVNRVTAWFRCKKCVKYAQGAMTATRPLPPMDFNAACEHRCAHLNKRERARAKWSADQFEVDQVVVKEVTRLLNELKLDPEDEEVNGSVRLESRHFRCMSCPSGLRLDFESMVRHCRRHEQPRFTPLQGEGISIEHGIALELVRGLTKDAVQRASLKVYGCRHCQEVRNVVREEGVNNDPKKFRLEMKEKMYSFNGLRSHLREKHVVAHIDDEDLFRNSTKEAQAVSVEAD